MFILTLIISCFYVLTLNRLTSPKHNFAIKLHQTLSLLFVIMAWAEALALLECYYCTYRCGTTEGMQNHIQDRRHVQSWRCSLCSDIVYRSRAETHAHITQNHTTPFQCRVCQKFFMTAAALTEHNEATTHGFPCQDCQAVLDSMSQLEAHETEFHKVCCDQCERVFNRLDDLREHQARDHAYECPDCNRFFPTMALLQAHLNSPQHTFECDECHYTFRTRGALEQHKDSPAHSFECETCKNVFRTTQALDCHIALAHKYMCNKCSKDFDDPIILQLHKVEKHVFRCVSCNFSFESEAGLQRHRDQSHLIKCLKCSRYFESQAQLEHHIPIEHIFACGKCPLVFNTNTALITHVSEAHTFECEKCKEIFHDSASYEQHKATSHVVNCDKCSLAFSSPAELETHVSAIHILHCQECPATFWSAAALDEHYNTTHIFKCDKCSEGFDSLEARDEHKASAHAFPCENCEQAYGSLAELVRHSITHCLQCKKCPDQSFSSAAEFQEHVEGHIHDDQTSTQGSSTSSENGGSLGSLHVSVDTTINGVTDLITPAFLDAHFLRCEKCPTALFATKAAHDEHVRDSLNHQSHLVQEAVIYSCSTCTYTCEAGSTLANHIIQDHFFRCQQCLGLRFCNEQELSEHTAKNHVPVIAVSTAVQTDAVEDFMLATSLGVEPYNSESTDGSFKSAHSSQQTEHAQTHSLPLYETKASQTTIYHCDECVGVFDTEEDLAFHMENSPFHGPPLLFCTECHVGTFQNQIELLKHIESKPHKTQWVLSMVSE